MNSAERRKHPTPDEALAFIWGFAVGVAFMTIAAVIDVLLKHR